MDGVMPEDLPTPNKSIKQIEKEKTITINKLSFIKCLSLNSVTSVSL